MKDSSDRPGSQNHMEENVRKEFLQLWGKLCTLSNPFGQLAA